MYYDEQIINGVLHWRGTPNGEWIPKNLHQLTERIVELEARIKLLEHKPQHIPLPVPVQPVWVVPTYPTVRPWEVTCSTDKV